MIFNIGSWFYLLALRLAKVTERRAGLVVMLAMAVDCCAISPAYLCYSQDPDLFAMMNHEIGV